MCSSACGDVQRRWEISASASDKGDAKLKQGPSSVVRESGHF